MNFMHTLARATNRRRCGCAVLGIALSSITLAAWAETVSIPLGQQGNAWNVETPRTGVTKQQVQDRFGEPQRASGPVGDPPIYTWDYGQFSVYFESDRVIHSVVKHQSSAQSSQTQSAQQQ